LPWEVLTVRKIHVRTSHRPVVTRANPTTWRKHQIKFNPRKKKTRCLFSLAYEFKSNRWKRCIGEFHLKLVLPASTVWWGKRVFSLVFQFFRFEFALFTLPFSSKRLNFSSPAISWQHIRQNSRPIWSFSSLILFQVIFNISFTIHWLLFRLPSWHRSLAEANMCLLMYSLLICLDPLKAFLV